MLCNKRSGWEGAPVTRLISFIIRVISQGREPPGVLGHRPAFIDRYPQKCCDPNADGERDTYPQVGRKLCTYISSRLHSGSEHSYVAHRAEEVSAYQAKRLRVAVVNAGNNHWAPLRGS